ncbi:uncharacterized protein [Nicotiana tomentosiformis]|uniref:uncharacterized protein n=1 Tax=Nicotiana tomentosiformis TaxID=4098 RepID=UPI00388CDAE3
MCEKPQVEKFTVEKGVGDLGKEVDTTAIELMVEGEGCKEPVQKEASNGLSFNWTEDEDDDGGEKEEKVVNSHEEHGAQNIANEEENSENGGASGDEKESNTDDKTCEHVNDSAEGENHIEEEDDSESEGEDQEKVSESEGGNDESKEEDENVSEESEGSMTIENTVISLSEETGEATKAQEPESLLTPFAGDEEVSSDGDNMPLSEVGKKPGRLL